MHVVFETLESLPAQIGRLLDWGFGCLRNFLDNDAVMVRGVFVVGEDDFVLFDQGFSFDSFSFQLLIFFFLQDASHFIYQVHRQLTLNIA